VAKITQNVLNRLKAHAVRIVGPFSSGDGVPVVRADIKCQVDATGLPNQESLNYKWTISGGDPVAKLPLDQPVFEALMPSSPTPVTVTVEIDDGAGYEAFGTLTFTPLSEQDYLQFQLWNSLRELATLAQTAFKKDNKNSLVFPLWDASLGRALTPSLQDLQYVVLGAQQLTRLAEQLRELAERLIDGTKDSKG
jgi:hypothetical protein